MEKLGPTDTAILRILQKDAKVGAKEIANRLNLTPSPVYDRIRRLEKLGYIKKYVAILDRTQMDLPITAFCQVSMNSHSEAFIENFEKKVQDLEEVQACYHMAGQVDFLLKIHIKNMEAYHDFVKYKLSKIDNIGTLNTTFVLKDIKNSSEYYI